MNDLARIPEFSITKALRLLEEASTFKEVQELADVGRMAVAMGQHIKDGREITVNAAEFVLRAEVKLGEMTAELALGKRGPRKDSPGARTKSQVLENIGIDRRRASELERLGEVDLDTYFDNCREADRLPSLNGALSISSASDYDGDEWFTPAEWIERARQALGAIDLDPASNAHAQKTVRASKFYTKADDGLSKPWTGRVFCNPPYSPGMVRKFTDRLLSDIDAGVCTAAILLTNNTSDSKWFHDLLRAGATVCLTRGRVAFEDTVGQYFATRQGQAFFYFGPNPGLFTEAFADAGTIVKAI